MTFGEQPAYLRVAGDLRKKIADGLLPPHTRLPSQARIREEYGVSDTVALEARKVLMAEGLVEGRSGSGTYVRERPVPRRVARPGTGPPAVPRPSARSRPTPTRTAPGSRAANRPRRAVPSPSGWASSPVTG
ncbi:hypothetical protein SVIOM342S_01030 [Streptomyces violaceorubidus]